MKITKELLSEIFNWYIEDLHEARICAKYAEDYLSAFQAGTLDIEGYERNKWHKLDSDDLKTCPHKEGDYFVLLDNGKLAVASMTCWFELNGEFLRDDQVIAWRELPQKPKF